MRSSKQAKMNVDGLKDVKVRKRMSVAGIPLGGRPANSTTTTTTTITITATWSIQSIARIWQNMVIDG
jgi:hypothetical protein